jgi:hypothetical protein
MTLSAAALGITGILLSFFPTEIAVYFGLIENASIILQILGAPYFGFAILNWTAKANLIGGIYSRPVAIGNFSHFLIGALALLKLVFNIGLNYLLAAAIIYSIFAILFGYVLFTNPVAKNQPV